jgi:hypothetical protein
MKIEMELDERFALLDFRAIPYLDTWTRPEEAKTRYQAILVDRQRGWAQINGVRLNGPANEKNAQTAWALLETWAEQTANGRLHPGEVGHLEELPGHDEGSSMTCETCIRFFACVKTGGVGKRLNPALVEPTRAARQRGGVTQ